MNPYPSLSGTDPADIKTWCDNVTRQRFLDIQAFNNSPKVSSTTTAIAGDLAVFASDGKTLIDGGAVPIALPQTVILLSTKTASNSAAVGWTTNFDGTYKRYYVEVIDLITATDNVHLLAEFYQSGAYLTGANYRGGVGGCVSNNDSGFFGFSGKTAMQLGWDNGDNYFTTSSTEPTHGVVDLFDPAATTSPSLGWRLFGSSSGPLGVYYSGGGIYNGSNGAFTGIQFLTTSGNITSGTFKLYGVL